MRIAERTLSLLARTLEFLAVVMMTLMAIFVVLSAVMRYAFSAPFSFTEEIVGLLFCGIVFTTLANVQLEGRHIRVDLLEGVFGACVSRVQSLFRLILTAVFYLWFGGEAVRYFSFVYRSSSATVIGEIPLYPWIGLIVFSLASCLFIVILKLFRPPDNEAGERH